MEPILINKLNFYREEILDNDNIAFKNKYQLTQLYLQLEGFINEETSSLLVNRIYELLYDQENKEEIKVYDLINKEEDIIPFVTEIFNIFGGEDKDNLIDQLNKIDSSDLSKLLKKILTFTTDEINKEEEKKQKTKGVFKGLINLIEDNLKGTKILKDDNDTSEMFNFFKELVNISDKSNVDTKSLKNKACSFGNKLVDENYDEVFNFFKELVDISDKSNVDTKSLKNKACSFGNKLLDENYDEIYDEDNQCIKLLKEVLNNPKMSTSDIMKRNLEIFSSSISKKEDKKDDKKDDKKEDKNLVDNLKDLTDKISKDTKDPEIKPLLDSFVDLANTAISKEEENNRKKNLEEFESLINNIKNENIRKLSIKAFEEFKVNGESEALTNLLNLTKDSKLTESYNKIKNKPKDFKPLLNDLSGFISDLTNDKKEIKFVDTLGKIGDIISNNFLDKKEKEVFEKSKTEIKKSMDDLKNINEESKSSFGLDIFDLIKNFCPKEKLTPEVNLMMNSGFLKNIVNNTSCSSYNNKKDNSSYNNKKDNSSYNNKKDHKLNNKLEAKELRITAGLLDPIPYVKLVLHQDLTNCLSEYEKLLETSINFNNFYSDHTKFIEDVFKPYFNKIDKIYNPIKDYLEVLLDFEESDKYQNIFIIIKVSRNGKNEMKVINY